MGYKLKELDKEEEIKQRVEDNIRLIYSPTKRFYASNMVKQKYEFDELLSVSTLALRNASEKFDESKGFKFSTYAIPLIKFALIEFTRRDKWYFDRKTVRGKSTFEIVDRISTSALVKSKSGTIEVGDSLEDKEEFYENSDNAIIVESLLSTCTDREKGILKAYFFEEKPQSQIAIEFKTSQSYISHVIKRNLEKFKKILGEKVL